MKLLVLYDTSTTGRFVYVESVNIIYFPVRPNGCEGAAGVPNASLAFTFSAKIGWIAARAVFESVRARARLKAASFAEGRNQTCSAKSALTILHRGDKASHITTPHSEKANTMSRRGPEFEHRTAIFVSTTTLRLSVLLGRSHADRFSCVLSGSPFSSFIRPSSLCLVSYRRAPFAGGRTSVALTPRSWKARALKNWIPSPLHPPREPPTLMADYDEHTPTKHFHARVSLTRSSGQF